MQLKIENGELKMKNRKSRVESSFPKTGDISTPPLFIEEVARSAGGVCYNRIILFQKTPSPLRGAPSINRGRAGILSRFGKRFYSFVLWIGLACCLASCEQTVDYNGEYPDPKLVMYAFVKPDSTVGVQIGQTFFFGDTLSNDRLDAEGELYVNGKLAGSLAWDETGYHFAARPRRGDHLRVVARVKGFPEVEGEVMLPEKAPEIEVDTFSSTEMEQQRMNYRVTIKDEGTGRRYYRLIVESYDYHLIDGEIVNPSLSYAFFTDKDPLLEGSSSVWFDEDDRNRYHVFTNEVFEGKSYVMKVSTWRRYSSVTTGEINGQQVTQHNVSTCRVKVVHIDRATYQYLKSAEMADRGEGVMEPVQVYSNVKNGVGIVGYANEAIADFVMPEKNILYTN